MLLVAHRTPATRVGCERLAAAGAKVFEIDVQVDGHGRLVVSHFFAFGRGGYVQRDNWRFRWHTAAKRDPLLHDVAAVVPRGCDVLLDLKGRIPERRAQLRHALIDALPDSGRFIVCGPNQDELDELRAAGFRTWRTVGNARELRGVLASTSLRDDAVTIRHSMLTPELLERLHRLVPSVMVWTVNNVARARRLQAMGVDGVTTDRIAVLDALAHGAN